MEILRVERLGGFAGFGGERAHICSNGEIAMETLSTADQQAVESLFLSTNRRSSLPARDTFRYRISRTSAHGVEIIEVPEDDVPMVLRQCVRDELI